MWLIMRFEEQQVGIGGGCHTGSSWVGVFFTSGEKGHLPEEMVLFTVLPGSL